MKVFRRGFFIRVGEWCFCCVFFRGGGKVEIGINGLIFYGEIFLCLLLVEIILFYFIFIDFYSELGYFRGLVLFILVIVLVYLKDYK